MIITQSEYLVKLNFRLRESLLIFPINFKCFLNQLCQVHYCCNIYLSNTESCLDKKQRSSIKQKMHLPRNIHGQLTLFYLLSFQQLVEQCTVQCFKWLLLFQTLFLLNWLSQHMEQIPKWQMRRLNTQLQLKLMDIAHCSICRIQASSLNLKILL